MAAASELFLSNAYAAVSVDEIAQRAGLTKVTVYQHFKSKDALFLACLRRRLKRREAKLNHFLAELPAKADPLLAVFDWLEGWLDPKNFRGCSFVKAVNELAAVVPEVREIALDAKQRIAQRLTSLAKSSRRSHPDQLARQLALLFEGAQSLALIEQSARPAQVARQTARLLLDSSDYAPGAARKAVRGAHD